MAETVKKTKAAAKPRKTATKNGGEAVAAKAAAPSRNEIAQLAKSFWAARGYKDGFAEQDWLRAERELLPTAS